MANTPMSGAAAAASGATGPTMMNRIVMPLTSGGQSAVHHQPALRNYIHPPRSGSPKPLPPLGQQHKSVASTVGMQLHSMRPPLQSAQSFQARSVGAAASGSGANINSVSGAQPLAEAGDQPSEQTAFELASSAAARVTATGTAAAAMAAAKFKMLRSNTLAAAFGGGGGGGGGQASNGSVDGQNTSTGGAAAASGGAGAQQAAGGRDLMAMMRSPRDERVVNAVANQTNRSNL